MALVHCDFFSDVLGLSASMTVVLPQATSGQIGMASVAPRRVHPTLYLLHGLSDDHTIWQRRTSIERYVADLGLAVVMPGVHRSFYTDMAHGYPYWTFVSEELPRIARSFFPLSERREDNFVAGLSMGGYGALKLALRCPERYCAAASLSGALDLVGLFSQRAEQEAEWRNVFGDLDAIAGSDHDLLHLAEQVAASPGPKPRLFIWCGTEDELHAGNVRVRDRLIELGLDLTYSEGPGGHDWACWDEHIQDVLRWLSLSSG